MGLKSNKAKRDTSYSRLFARVYNPVMRNLERKFLKKKRMELLQGLEGNIMEVGAGTGINFDLYNPYKTYVFAFEPSESMLAYAEKKLDTMERKNHIKIIKAGVGDELPLENIPEEGFDYIVFTLVLCTIPDAKSAIEIVKKYLNKNGKIIVLEHISAKGGIGKFLQNSINPIWRHCAEGCHLNRATDVMLKEMGLNVISESYFYKFLPFYMAILSWSE